MLERMWRELSTSPISLGSPLADNTHKTKKKKSSLSYLLAPSPPTKHAILLSKNTQCVPILFCFVVSLFLFLFLFFPSPCLVS